jgi:hypothetical protein
MATLRQIQETLTQTTGAQFLYQPVIDRALFESTRKFTLTREIFARKTWNTPVYEFNKRNNYPQTRAVVEAPPSTGVGSVTPTSSAYSQVFFPIKHWQSNMDLAKFSIQTARVNGDLMQLELDAASESAVWFEEALNLYGSAGATNNTWRPEWDGVDLLMSLGNKIVVNAAPSIAMLDAMIDAVKKSLGRAVGPQYVFGMAPEMLSSMGRLFTQYERWMGKATIYPRDDRGVLKGQISDNRNYIDAGIEVATYRGVPLMESSFLTSLGTMTAVTAAGPTGTDGVIPAGTYYYSVEVLTDFGISLAAETSVVTVSSTNHVALSWTTPAILDVNLNVRQNLLFRIFRTVAGGPAGSETLYAVVAASDLASDAAITTWTDTGAVVNPYASGSTALATTIATSGSNVAIPDGVTVPRLSPSGHVQQDIFLLPRDPDILCVPVVNEMQTVPLALINARTQQVALTGDQVLAVRGPGFMAKASGVYVA